MSLVRPAEDLTARARIRDAAFALIAERGASRATLRAIAESAEVSSSLVVHHYGSKKGVVDAVASWVLDVLCSAVDGDVGSDDPATANARRIAAYEALFDELPPLSGYIRRMLLDDTDEGLQWFGAMVDNTVAILRRREGLGLARKSTDVRAEAALLNFMSLGPVLMPRYLEQVLGADTSAKATRRWYKAASELFQSALYPPRSASRP